MTAAPSTRGDRAAQRRDRRCDAAGARVSSRSPSSIRFDDLHFVLQIAIGWQNGHPFEFRIGDKVWGLPDRDLDIRSRRNARRSPTFSRTATASNTTMSSARTGSIPFAWRRARGAPGRRYPNLVIAEGRCPPADIGGPVGYETYLRTIADPTSVYHEDMLEFDAPISIQTWSMKQ